MSYLVQLRTFVEVYRSGSISRAAERLAMTQPAASAHVQALEALLEKQLFVRGARGVQSTIAADELARTVGGHLDAVEAGLSAYKARSTVVAGPIHIAGPAEFLGHRVAPLLAGLTEFGLKVRLMTGNRERIYGWLEDGSASLAITALRPSAKAFGFAEVARERLLLVAHPTLALRLGPKTTTMAALATAPLIAYDEELPLVREYTAAVFGAAPDMEAVVTVPDLRIVASLVTAATGWAVLPDYLCAKAVEAGTLVVLEGPKPPPENTLHLVWVKAALREARVAFVRDRLIEEAKRGAFGV